MSINHRLPRILERLGHPSQRRAARRRARSRPLAALEALEERTLLASAPASLSVSIFDARDFEGNDGPATITGTLDPGRTSDVYQVQGQPGQRILFDAMTDSPGASWQFYADGRSITGSSSFWIAGDRTIDLPLAENYTLIVSGSSDIPVDYGFRLFDVTDPGTPLSGLQDLYTGTLSGTES